MIGVFELQTNVACALIRKRDLPEIVKNLLLYLTEENKNILVGLLICDLFAEKQNVNARLEFTQGLPHKDYLIPFV